MPEARSIPIGLYVTRSARLLERAFEEALARAGGSTAIWLTLLAVKTGHGRNQREIADRIGIRGATLSHHLGAMETAGLLVRHRDPDNRRVHIVELTDRGHELFAACRAEAAAFDERLRLDLDDQQLLALRVTLDRMRRNVSPDSAPPGGPLTAE